ncbi:MAG: DUF3500 domain-containing protein [Planctomycetota bacterium]|nr:MAG: DUF3500 domain-containing protein [Planctomycetota bacterium]
MPIDIRLNSSPSRRRNTRDRCPCRAQVDLCHLEVFYRPNQSTIPTRCRACRASPRGWASSRAAVKFSWAGSLKPGIGHYYRVEGPTFVVELCNVQPDAEGNPANHIHCMWRDCTGDFDLPGRD